MTRHRLTIAPQPRPCVGVGPQDCLVVRWDGSAEWELLYDPIDGFTYEPGHTWHIEVDVDDPDPSAATLVPADASARSLRLVAVISQTSEVDVTSEADPSPQA